MVMQNLFSGIYKDKTVLVTGHTGFKGSWLVYWLKEMGANVIGYSLEAPTAPNHIELLKLNIISVVGDIRDIDKLNDTFAQYKPDIVFHLAAQIDLRKSLENPEEDYEINVTGSKNVIISAEKHGVKKFVFASSAAVYGDNQNLPIKETEPIKAQAQYGKSKAEIEDALKESKIPSVVLRYANAYGPRQGTIGEGGVIAVFCKRLISCEPITINGDGEQTRDFIFVQDIVNANIKALESEKDFALYNVSTTQETSVNEIANQLLKISQKTSKIEHQDPIKGEVLRNSLNNQFIRKELNWEPETDINKGLEKTWQWFNQNL